MVADKDALSGYVIGAIADFPLQEEKPAVHPSIWVSKDGPTAHIFGAPAQQAVQQRFEQGVTGRNKFCLLTTSRLCVEGQFAVLPEDLAETILEFL
jgi:hypothetical protein